MWTDEFLSRNDFYLIEGKLNSAREESQTTWMFVMFSSSYVSQLIY